MMGADEEFTSHFYKDKIETAGSFYDVDEMFIPTDFNKVAFILEKRKINIRHSKCFFLKIIFS